MTTPEPKPPVAPDDAPPDSPFSPPGHTLHEAEVAALESQGDTHDAAEAAVTAAEAAADPDTA